jgi:hypothetical protein
MSLNKYFLFIVSIMFSCAAIAANPVIFEKSARLPHAKAALNDE